ncbi:hypothetical protein AVEN_220767-1 [Araneus ventricosus]|uniref:Uncharacterized protein n=1 Tax=Araneus ventricosus TaxID=182803 RepID=A0A4Y2LWX1_ARAVE|nr:hypothetical protein AVEN_220767-1 [Araneus ventricosus]
MPACQLIGTFCPDCHVGGTPTLVQLSLTRKPATAPISDSRLECRPDGAAGFPCGCPQRVKSTVLEMYPFLIANYLSDFSFLLTAISPLPGGTTSTWVRSCRIKKRFLASCGRTASTFLFNHSLLLCRLGTIKLCGRVSSDYGTYVLRKGLGLGR